MTMKKIFGAALAAAVIACVSVPAFAQNAAPAGSPPTSLADLLQRVREQRQGADASYKQWVADYNAASPDQQKAMMKGAQARHDQLLAASKGLSDTYSANQVKIDGLNAALSKKADSLGLSSVFGLSRQVANDVSSTLEQSLVNSQIPVVPGQPTRVQFLRSFATARTTPTPQQLERLWIEIQREMTAQGEVAKYKAPVVQPGGKAVVSDVIRIGPFTASSNGKFLSYVPNLNQLTVLPRQLPAEFMSTLADFQNATSGYARAVVDSTRGVLLGLYVERPTWLQRIELGQSVGYVIITVGLAGAAAFLFQLVKLVSVRLAVGRQLKNLDDPKANNPLGRVLLAFRGDPETIDDNADVAELRITEAVLHEVPKLQRFQPFLKLAVAAGPLLGLIGTVIGMILTFQSITESGSSDPRLMATGIGQAMIATVLGLGCAIPLLFANALLGSLSRGVVQILDEQSAGILAESIEKQTHA